MPPASTDRAVWYSHALTGMSRGVSRSFAEGSLDEALTARVLVDVDTQDDVVLQRVLLGLTRAQLGQGQPHRDVYGGAPEHPLEAAAARQLPSALWLVDAPRRPHRDGVEVQRHLEAQP
ncbi:MAG: hypothetical protein WCG47_03705, partial [Dermatophilaceae bacterium]